MSALEIVLKGGLCNKLFCLFSACDIAINNKYQLIEPYFGWKRKILFSEIYDIHHFNHNMRKYNNGIDIMIPINEKSKYNVKKNEQDLWTYSEKILKLQRNINEIDSNCMMLIVLQSLQLNEKNKQMINSLHIYDKNAIHIRIESDWVPYSNRKEKNLQNELFLIDINSLINIYLQKFSTHDVFFTTGENQFKVQEKFKDVNINTCFFFDNNLEYEMNAALNFHLCCCAKTFIGISRSTFSNLITLKRHLMHKNDSYIYNLNNDILLRKDIGLHGDPLKSVYNDVHIFFMFDVVYFVSLILDWERVCMNNAITIFKSGILNDKRCRTFNIVFTGNQELTQRLKDIFNNDTRITFLYKGTDVKTHEYYGINEIVHLSTKFPNDRLLYFHSKGITRKGAADDWVAYLEFFVVLNYKKCLEKLSIYDVVGTEYLRNPVHHMSGNFWWTTAAHISKLKLSGPHSEMHAFERFILSSKQKTTIWNFHDSKSTKGFPGFNTKRRRYEENEYNDINKGKCIVLYE